MKKTKILLQISEKNEENLLTFKRFSSIIFEYARDECNTPGGVYKCDEPRDCGESR